MNSLTIYSIMTMLILSSLNCNADERNRLQEKKVRSSQKENKKSSPQKKALIILSDSPTDFPSLLTPEQLELSPRYLSVQEDQFEITGKIMDMKVLLKSESPRLRAIAAQSLALIRIEMGDAEQNVKHLPVFVKLLKDEDSLVRQVGLDHLAPVIRESPKKSLKPFVQPLMQVIIDDKNLVDNSTVSKAIKLLGDIGADANEALPLLQSISNKKDHGLINFSAVEAKLAIEKIQSNDN